MAVLAVTNTLANGQTSDASLWNTNYSDIVTWLNNLYNGTTTWTAVKATNFYFAAGSASAPSIAVTGDTTTGFFQVSAGVLGASILGVKAADFFSVGSTNATTYVPFRVYSNAVGLVVEGQKTTGCTTSAVTILTSTVDAGIALVYGKQTAGGTTEFFDTVQFGAGGASPQAIKQTSNSGSPDTRTYSQSGTAFKVQMGGNTYTVTVKALSIQG